MKDYEVRSAQELLSPLRDFPDAPPSELEAEAMRARVVPALRTCVRRAVARRGRVVRRRWAAMAVGGLAVAASVAAFVLLRTPTPAPAPLARETLDVFVESGRVVHRSELGDAPIESGRPVRIVASGALATLEDASARIGAGGVEIGLGGWSEVGLEELGSESMERVRLHRGVVRCVVPSLGSTHRFSVVTPDATVVVHGTVFSVEVSPDPRAMPRTCVTVEDGVVSVRHRAGIARLSAGESWGCARRPVEPRAPEVPPATEVSASAGATARQVLAQPAPAEALAEQNRLFQGALSAERRGEIAVARAALHELLQRHPSSPLAPEARTMLGRIEGR